MLKYFVKTTMKTAKKMIHYTPFMKCLLLLMSIFNISNIIVLNKQLC